MPERIFGIMGNYVLLAIPFFIFMGIVLERARLAEDLLTTIGKLFGALRGGLALGVVFVGALLAAATGVVGASVVAMGSISLPVMLKYGYDKRLSSGIILASGTLGQIIPPSIVLVVLADQLGISVGALFVGALVPGLHARRACTRCTRSASPSSSRLPRRRCRPTSATSRAANWRARSHSC
jgi:tripartite ATP-independent transporter DctM subunit